MQDYNLSSFAEYDVEVYLLKFSLTSSNYDDLPWWVFKYCSYELATSCCYI